MEKLKVLLVDDDDNLRFIGQISLEDGAGWTVIPASSGREALELASKEKPDVILLDIMMPGMDGIQTLSKIREEGLEMPVIFMTAKVQRHEVEEYLKLGISGVISKPFDPMTLPDEVLNIVSGVETA